MKILSLDIETYGACERTLDGRPLPVQTQTNPHREMAVDGVERRDLVQTACLTFGEFPIDKGERPRLPSLALPVRNHAGFIVEAAVPVPTDVWRLDQLEVGETMPFVFGSPRHAEWLGGHLYDAEVVVGHNIAFDIMHLRALPGFDVPLAPFGLTLLDTSILSYLESEVRPEKGLKNISPVIGTHTFTDTLKEGRFPDPTTPRPGGGDATKTCLHYNAVDSLVTLLNAKEHARRILEGYPDTHKLTATALRYFSDCLWDLILMQETGLHFSLPRLRDLHAELLRTQATAKREARRIGLLVGGTGCQTSQQLCTSNAIAALDGVEMAVEGQPPIHDILSHPLLEHGKETKRVSWSRVNRGLFLQYLPKGERQLRRQLILANTHDTAKKLTSTYTGNLLGKQGAAPDFSKVKLVPQPHNPDVGVAHPSWFATPSRIKDEQASDERGQKQARPSCTDPAALTFPPLFRKTYCPSREGGVILAADASQHELRIAGALSGDTYLLEAFQKGIDLHAARALQVFGEGIKDSPDFAMYRTCAKHGNFLDLNWGGPDRLRATIKKKSGLTVSLSLCEEIVSSREAQRPGLLAWQREVVRFAHQHHCIELPFTGHSRIFLPTADRRQRMNDNEVVNFPIQAVAAIVVWSLQHHYSRDAAHELQSPVFLNHYDALWLDCPNLEAAEQAKTALLNALAYEMQRGYWSRITDLTGNAVPLALDFKLIIA
jgi:hypothetical protein